MSHKRGMGLIMEWFDIPQDKDQEFNKWYNEERFAQIMSVPLVLNGARYYRTRSPYAYLNLYELECPEVVDTEAFQKVQKDVSAGARKLAPDAIGQNYVWNVYRQIYPDHIDPILAQTDPGPHLNIGAQDVPNEVDVIFNRWYHTIYMRDMPKVPGVIVGRRFYCVKGGPRYLTIYELERHDVTESKEWVAARDNSPWSASVRANIKQSIGASHPPQVHSRIFPTKAD